MLPSQISRTSHFGSRGSLSISERVDFQPLLIRKNARIKKIKINSNVMLHPIDTVGRLHQMDFPLIPSEVAIRLNIYGNTISTASPRTCRIAAEEPALTDLILLAFALLQLALFRHARLA